MLLKNSIPLSCLFFLLSLGAKANLEETHHDPHTYASMDHDEAFQHYLRHLVDVEDHPQGQHHHKAKAYFHDNLHYIHKRNRELEEQGASYRLGVTHHAHLSNHEFKQRFTKKPSAKIKVDHHTGDTGLHFGHLDWRDYGAVTPVLDQKKCSACWSFAASGALEGAYYLKTGKLIAFSPQQMIDCGIYNDGCKGGNTFLAFEELIDIGEGLCPLKSYPYKGKKGKCNKTVVKKCQPDVTVRGYNRLPSGSDQDIAEALQKQPVSIAIYASGKDLQHYKKGVYTGKECPQPTNPHDLDHEVLLVGYGVSDDGQPYWLIKNSWSHKWGEKGYLRLNRATPNNCGMALFGVVPEL